MHERHLRAVRDVEAGAQRPRRQHRDDGHAVHVVGDGFAVADAEAPPAFALGGFEAREEVQEGEGGGRLRAGWWGGQECEG